MKLAQDFIKEARQEAGLQNTYQVVSYGRGIARSVRWGKRSKVITKNLKKLKLIIQIFTNLTNSSH